MSRPIIKKERVRLESGPAAGTLPTCAPASQPAQAELVRVDGRVCGIRVQCSCGSTTVLELEFEPEHEAPTPEATP